VGLGRFAGLPSIGDAGLRPPIPLPCSSSCERLQLESKLFLHVLRPSINSEQAAVDFNRTRLIKIKATYHASKVGGKRSVLAHDGNFESIRSAGLRRS
jgi:hypothetical protein